MLSASQDNRGKTWNSLALLFLPERFMLWYESLWEGYHTFVDSNNLQHLQTTGSDGEGGIHPRFIATES